MTADGAGTAPGRAGAAKRIFLHVGEPKTGTTFLQQVMWTNRAELAAQGFIYPGPRGNAHWRASQDLLDTVQAPDDPAPTFKGEWDRIVAEAMTARHTGIISHELFAEAAPAQVERALRSLDAVEVHLVMTVRDIASLVPAEYQETVKHRNKSRWEDWADAVLVSEAADPDRRRMGFWRVHDTLEVLKVWQHGEIPPERVHVITMPSRSATDSLWDRFARVVGIDTSMVDPTRARQNISLGVAEVETVRRLNEILSPSYPDWSYQWYVKDTLAQHTFPKREMSPRLQLPSNRQEYAEKEAAHLIAGLRDRGYHIVGDLDELLPRPTVPPELSPSDVPADELLDTALFAMTGMLNRMETMRQNFRRGQQPQIAGFSPLKSAVIALTEQHPVLHKVRVGYWRAAHLTRRLRRGGQGPAAT